MSDESTERLPEERQFSTILMGSCATAGVFLLVFIALKGVNCCAWQPPAAGGARPFRTIREARTAATGVVPALAQIFVEFLVGRLDLGCRDRLLQMRHPRGAAPAGFRQRAARTVTVTKTVPLLQASARRHEQLVLRSHVQVWLVLKK
jgi:hypothetical protein